MGKEKGYRVALWIELETKATDGRKAGEKAVRSLLDSVSRIPGRISIEAHSAEDVETGLTTELR